MKPVKRDSFIFYKSFHDAIKTLPDNERLEVMDAIMMYAIDGQNVDLNGITKSIFTLIKPQIDANNKRFKNGKNGGRPKTYKEKPKRNQTVTKTKPNVNVNVNVNENVNNTPLPPFIDHSMWDDFVKHRGGSKFTKLARKRILNQLEKWHDEGHNVNEILNRSIMNGWKGVFEPKQKKESRNDIIDRQTREAISDSGVCKSAIEDLS